MRAALSVDDTARDDERETRTPPEASNPSTRSRAAAAAAARSQRDARLTRASWNEQSITEAAGDKRARAAHIARFKQTRGRERRTLGGGLGSARSDKSSSSGRSGSLVVSRLEAAGM